VRYQNMIEGKFIERPNRFIAYVEVDGNTEKCHVCNTGRCKELLVPGARVFLSVSNNEKRSTKYDLVVVDKVLSDGSVMRINMDSQAPNNAAKEWIESGGLFDDVKNVYREKTYGNSRFDILVERQKCNAFVEVKGVTLEEDGAASFPDAPTERGIKHLNELCRCIEDGYEAYALFVIQMSPIKYFTPNRETHPQFADALKKAKGKGVHVIAVTCNVGIDTLEVKEQVPVILL
jgi:sugar fermentation stimulation protein